METGKFYDASGVEITNQADITNLKNQAIGGTWKYLLKKSNNEIYTGYLLLSNEDGNGMNALISNMTKNIQYASLQDLSDDGFIDQSMLSSNTLSTPLNNLGGKVSIPNGKTKLGELTATEMLVYISSILNYLTPSGS